MLLLLLLPHLLADLLISDEALAEKEAAESAGEALLESQRREDEATGRLCQQEVVQALVPWCRGPREVVLVRLDGDRLSRDDGQRQRRRDWGLGADSARGGGGKD